MRQIICNTVMISVLLLIIPLLLCGCRKKCVDEHDNCTSEELSWLAYYGNEVLIFKRNDGIYDTINVGLRRSRDIQLSQPSMDGRKCASYAQVVSVFLHGNYIFSYV